MLKTVVLHHIFVETMIHLFSGLFIEYKKFKWTKNMNLLYNINVTFNAFLLKKNSHFIKNNFTDPQIWKI